MKAICFTGMDGSGKSTQCRLLARKLRSSGVDVKVIHILTIGNTVASSMQGKPLLRVLRQRLIDLPCVGFPGVVKLLIGLFVFPVDAWATSVQHRLRYKGKIIIYDRFFYDQFLIFVTKFPKIPWWALHITKILPRNDVTIVMEVPPEVAHFRKPQESIDKLRRSLQFYRRLTSIFKFEIIDGTYDIERIADRIYQRSTR